jgi:site-specific recombinase XerD
MMENERQFDYYLMTQRLAEASRISIIKQVNTFLLWIEREGIPDVTEVSYNDIMGFVKECGKAVNSQKTAAIKLAFLNHYFMWLVKTGEMIENPASNIVIQGITRRKLHQTLKRENLDGIYQRYEQAGAAGMRNRCLLGLVVYQALRMDEISKLTVKDIQFREGKIQITGGRKSRGRTLKLEAHQIVELLEYLNEGRKQLLSQTGKQTDSVFISSGGGDQLLNTFQHLLGQLKKQHPDVKDWKQLRASVISNWVASEGLRKAQYLAGHRFASSTEEYKQQDLDELRGDIDQFHPFQ